MKRNKKVIILGIGGTSRDILDIVQELEYLCVGFLDDDKNNWGKSINGIKVFGPLSQSTSFKNAFFINGIGSPANFLQKEKILTKTALSLDRFITLIHPSAFISKTSIIGSGTVIFQNVVISSNTTIGNHVVILPNSIISHDNKLGDYTCVAGGVCISGSVQVGKSCYLGAGSLVKEGVSIADKSIVGIGSVVLKDVKKNSVYVGNPAKFLRPS